MEFMEQQMDNSELTIDAFAEHLMMSRTIFYRKLKSIIGLLPWISYAKSASNAPYN